MEHTQLVAVVVAILGAAQAVAGVIYASDPRNGGTTARQ